MMKSIITGLPAKYLYPLIFLSTILISGCQIIGGIFKAGVWVGIIVVVFIFALILFIISKFRK